MSADQIYAKVIADSVGPGDHRVTTLEVCFNRFVLAEVNTHRMFSRNSASSRAIPFRKQRQRVLAHPAMPVAWPQEQKGMQGGEEVDAATAVHAKKDWIDAAVHAAHYANRLATRGVHKSVANRLLEPFLMHTAVITATDWTGFFDQRCSPLAQPELRVAAEMMRAEYEASTPEPLAEGKWHLPYIDQSDIALAEAYIRANGDDPARLLTNYLVQMSSARCARVSYETQDGKREVEADLDLYDRLVSARPAHWSPLEHPCTPWPENVQTVSGSFPDLTGAQQPFHIIRPVVGNFRGFRQHRFEMESAA